MKKSQLTEMIREELHRQLSEAKDETNIPKAKQGIPKGFDRASWDWRIHSKGSYWQSPKGFGARALSGEVDYFKDKKTAIKFAGYTHKGKPGSYVRGNFKEGAGEELAKGVKKEADISQMTTTKITPAVEKKLIDAWSKSSLSSLRNHQTKIQRDIKRAHSNKDTDKLTVLQQLDRIVAAAIDKKEFGEGCKLKEMATGAKVECMECGKRFTARSSEPKCPRCGGYDIDMAYTKESINAPATFYSSKDKAERVATQNNKTDDDGWKYIVKPKGKYFVIVVYDEHNKEVGTL